jgi:hypothetical protein
VLLMNVGQFVSDEVAPGSRTWLIGPWRKENVSANGNRRSAFAPGKLTPIPIVMDAHPVNQRA